MSHTIVPCLAAIVIAAFGVECKPLLLLDQWEDVSSSEHQFDSSEEFYSQPQLIDYHDSPEEQRFLAPKMYVLTLSARYPTLDADEDYLQPRVPAGRGLFSKVVEIGESDYMDGEPNDKFDTRSFGGGWQSQKADTWRVPEFHSRWQLPKRERDYKSVPNFVGWQDRVNRNVEAVDQSPTVAHNSFLGSGTHRSPIVPKPTYKERMDKLTNKAADTKMEELQRQAVTSFLQSLALKRKYADQLSQQEGENLQIQESETIKYHPNVIQI